MTLPLETRWPARPYRPHRYPKCGKLGRLYNLQSSHDSSLLTFLYTVQSNRDYTVHRTELQEGVEKYDDGVQWQRGSGAYYGAVVGHAEETRPRTEARSERGTDRAGRDRGHRR